MSCDARGRCHFCCKKHVVPVFGSDETVHALLQRSNLRLVVLNTVCSPCISKLEDLFKKNFPDLRLPFERKTVKKGHTKNPTGFTSQNISIGNSVEITEESQVNETLQTQSTIRVNRVISCGNTQSEEVAKIHVGIEESFACGERVGIDNSRMDENAGGTRRKRRQLTCNFCQKAFNHTGDLNKHRRKHTGERPYTCNKCQQKFSYASNLIRHQRTHSGIKPFSCQICGRTFTRKDKLSDHLTAKHCLVKL
ncbi:unnamed protein product [Lasius platythorax]|uniref:C2H2-type domain-containing protein n=1 Tax=Lasius platythorax TaxID=488582 RepID=A0AAV2NAF1_9HYME